MSKLEYIIQSGDVGKRHIKLHECPICNTVRILDLSSVLGSVQSIDIGKRIFRSGGILQVENDQQMASRLNTK